MPTAKEVNEACDKAMSLIYEPATVELGAPAVKYVIPRDWLPGMLLIAADGSAVKKVRSRDEADVIAAMESHMGRICNAALRVAKDHFADEDGDHGEDWVIKTANGYLASKE